MTPGPRTTALAARIAACEAPGINTLVGDAGTETDCVWLEALGANVLDVDGNVFLDLTAGFGVAAVGHRHPAVVAAAAAQADRLVHGLGDVFSHPGRIALAERLAARSPFSDARVYFAISGADAVEVALKTARLHTGRDRVLAFDLGYHGLTLGAARVTARAAFREPFDPRPEGVLRARFGGPLAPVEELLRSGRPGAVVVEPIVGREGVVIPPSGWLAELATLARSHGALLIADEIFVAFGRAGEWFVSPAEGVVPDLLCCGKALGGGWPIAAVLAEREIMECWRSDGEARHTATFVAHPIACAASLATLDQLEQLIPAAPRRLAEGLLPLLSAAREHGFEVRGRGALWGLVDQRAARLQRRLLEVGILALAGGPSGDVLQLCPPLVITDAQLAAVCERGIAALERLGSG